MPVVIGAGGVLAIATGGSMGTGGRSAAECCGVTRWTSAAPVLWRSR